MFRVLIAWWLAAVAALCAIVPPALAAGSGRDHLVDAHWLARNIGRDDMLVLDASPGALHAAGHIPGAVHADLFAFGASELPAAEMERHLQRWGIGPGKKIVLYDRDGLMWAARLFFDLYHLGVPAGDLAILDGGLPKWQAIGGAITQDTTPAPAPGGYRITQRRDEVRVRLPQFLAATGDPVGHAVVEALEPSHYFGGAKFFDRAGHVPNAIMLPREDLFNADKTFKSADEIRRMAGYLGIRPGQQIHTYCGGGVAAAVPFFALKFIAGYPDVRLYRESQLEWLRDDRSLPMWTYSAPNLKRDANWLNTWSGAMLRSFGVSQLSVVDVRPAPSYLQGHVPFALNIPAEVFRRHLSDPGALAALLGPAGVDPRHEAVIVSEGGLNPDSALAFVMLERLGQARVSVLMESVDEWGLRGFPLAKEATIVGSRKTPKDIVVSPASGHVAAPSAGGAAAARYPEVFVAAGARPPSRPVQGSLIHLPYTDLVDPDGTPKPAKDLWSIFAKAGLPRYAAIVSVADDPGEAAVNYVVLKLMGYPDVRIELR